MSWSVILSKDAANTLKKVQGSLRQRILEKIKVIAEDPYAPNNNIKALKGYSQSYRLRVGDWRVIYTLDDGALIVMVLKIGARGGVYD